MYTFLVKSILFVLISLMATFGYLPSALASSQSLCSAIFRDQPVTFEDIAQSSQGKVILSTLPSVSPRLWKRYWNHADVELIFQKILGDTQGKTNNIDLPGGDWLIARSLVAEDHLFLDLVHIQHKVDSVGVKIGQQSESMNSLLIKTLTAYLKTIYHYSTQANVSHAYIRGVNLKNPMLREMLEKNGFSRNDLHIYSVEMEKHLQFP